MHNSVEKGQAQKCKNGFTYIRNFVQILAGRLFSFPCLKPKSDVVWATWVSKSLGLIHQMLWFQCNDWKMKQWRTNMKTLPSGDNQTRLGFHTFAFVLNSIWTSLIFIVIANIFLLCLFGDEVCHGAHKRLKHIQEKSWNIEENHGTKKKAKEYHETTI